MVGSNPSKYKRRFLISYKCNQLVTKKMERSWATISITTTIYSTGKSKIQTFLTYFKTHQIPKETWARTLTSATISSLTMRTIILPRTQAMKMPFYHRKIQKHLINNQHHKLPQEGIVFRETKAEATCTQWLNSNFHLNPMHNNQLPKTVKLQ